MKMLRCPARAKINLYLRITGLRENGYHTLETVFQSVRLHDDVAIFPSPTGEISVRTDKRFLPADSRNIAYRAAQMFFECAGLKCPGLRIDIKKRIPVGGGMGGGSADAAAVLRSLNGAFGRPLGGDALLQLGLELGADVPFCLTGGTAFAGGVGERLEALPAMPRCFIVGCLPGISVSTKAAFALYDECGCTQDAPPADEMLRALHQGSLAGICAAMHNDFEAPVMQRWPRLREIKEQLLTQGAQGAVMTGSGAVVYGVFEEEARALAAASALSARPGGVFVTGPHAPAGR